MATARRPGCGPRTPRSGWINVQQMLRMTSTFLDRIEEVGITTHGRCPCARPGRPGGSGGRHPAGSAESSALLWLRRPGFRRSRRRRRRWLCPAAHPVCRGDTITASDGAGGHGLAVGPVAAPYRAAAGRGVGLGRSAPRRCCAWLRIGEDARIAALPDHAAGLYELARLSSGGGELRVSGFSHHSGDIRSFGGRKRPLTQKELTMAELGSQRVGRGNQDNLLSRKRRSGSGHLAGPARGGRVSRRRNPLVAGPLPGWRHRAIRAEQRYGRLSPLHSLLSLPARPGDTLGLGTRIRVGWPVGRRLPVPSEHASSSDR